MEGIVLLRLLIQSTGLPVEAVEKEVQRLISIRGLDPETLTLEDIREILAIYLQDVLSEAKSAY
ncbi:MAG TPA: hypothetical protein PKC28_01075 [Bdellovibrionales bacterium]|nr:hypothetical protein [Bdellovibrionales bacterium]